MTTVNIQQVIRIRTIEKIKQNDALRIDRGMRVAISYNFVKKVTDKLRFDQIPEANGEGSHIAI